MPFRYCISNVKSSLETLCSALIEHRSALLARGFYTVLWAQERLTDPGSPLGVLQFNIKVLPSPDSVVPIQEVTLTMSPASKVDQLTLGATNMLRDGRPRLKSKYLLRVPRTSEYLNPDVLLRKYVYVVDCARKGCVVELIMEKTKNSKMLHKTLLSGDVDTSDLKQLLPIDDRVGVLKNGLDILMGELDAFTQGAVSRKVLLLSFNVFLDTFGISATGSWFQPIADFTQESIYCKHRASQILLRMLQQLLNAHFVALGVPTRVTFPEYDRSKAMWVKKRATPTSNYSKMIKFKFEAVKFAPFPNPEMYQEFLFSVSVEDEYQRKSKIEESRYKWAGSLSSNATGSSLAVDYIVTLSKQDRYDLVLTSHLQIMLNLKSPNSVMKHYRGNLPLFCQADNEEKYFFVSGFFFVPLWPVETFSQGHFDESQRRFNVTQVPMLGVEVVSDAICQFTPLVLRRCSNLSAGSQPDSSKLADFRLKNQEEVFRPASPTEILPHLTVCRPFLELSGRHRAGNIELVKLLALLKFNDPVIISLVADAVDEMSSPLVCFILQHLLQAVTRLHDWTSPLVRALFIHVVKDARVAQKLFLLINLNARSCHLNKDKVWLMEMRTLLTTVIGTYFHLRLEKLTDFIEMLQPWARSTRSRVPTSSGDKGFDDGLKGLCITLRNWFASESKAFFLPELMGIEIVGIKEEQCKVMKSAQKPIMLALKTSTGDVVYTLFKDGDDLRQDMLIQDLVRLLNYCWATSAASSPQARTIELLNFRVFATGPTNGFIQIVEDSLTLRELYDAYNDDFINKYLNVLHTDDQLPLFHNILKTSCAGYLVANFLFGLADRHTDNIMIQGRTGNLFHIDFSKAFGDRQTFVGVDRDGSVFFNEEIKAVIMKSVKRYEEFQLLLCQAVAVVWSNIDLLLVFMEASNAFGVMTPAKMNFFHSRIQADSVDSSVIGKQMVYAVGEAATSFKQKINICWRNYLHGEKVKSERAPVLELCHPRDNTNNRSSQRKLSSWWQRVSTYDSRPSTAQQPSISFRNNNPADQEDAGVEFIHQTKAACSTRLSEPDDKQLSGVAPVPAPRRRIRRMSQKRRVSLSSSPNRSQTSEANSFLMIPEEPVARFLGRVSAAIEEQCFTGPPTNDTPVEDQNRRMVSGPPTNDTPVVEDQNRRILSGTPTNDTPVVEDQNRRMLSAIKEPEEDMTEQSSREASSVLPRSRQGSRLHETNDRLRLDVVKELCRGKLVNGKNVSLFEVAVVVNAGEPAEERYSIWRTAAQCCSLAEELFQRDDVISGSALVRSIVSELNFVDADTPALQRFISEGTDLE